MPAASSTSVDHRQERVVGTTRSLSVEPEVFALARPFTISRGTRIAAEVVTVTLGERGVTGRGECVPYPRYGESTASTIAAIEAIREELEKGADRAALQGLLPPGAARNAVDCALWDLEARLAGTTVAALAGRPPVGPIETGITIGIAPVGEMAAEAAALADVPLLKVKVDADDPMRRIEAVRAAAPRARLIVDPNESWSVRQLVELQDELLRARVDLLEQPVPASESSALAGVRSRVPVCADEAVHVAADVPGLVGLYDYVNIKLDKTGGLTEALALAEAARTAGLGLMVGCMLSSSLAIAPAMLVSQGAEFRDLDGPRLFNADRAGGIEFDRGLIIGPASGFWGG